MEKEVVDGSTVYSNLYADEDGRTWNFLIRDGGTASLYYTKPDIYGHFVIFDTSDKLAPSDYALSVVEKVRASEPEVGNIIAAIVK